MIKVLVLCKEFGNSLNLVNKVVCKISDLQLIGIALNQTDAKKILVQNEADIIITTDLETIKFIKREFITYKPCIILITSKIRIRYTYSKLLLINNKNKFEIIVDLIKFYLKNEFEATQKAKLSKVLRKLGFNYGWAGTIYLQDAILYAHSYKGSYQFEKLKRDIYSVIAKKNKTTSDRVKWSVERAIKYIYKRNSSVNMEYIEKVFKTKYPQKITSKQVISTLANIIDLL